MKKKLISTILALAVALTSVSFASATTKKPTVGTPKITYVGCGFYENTEAKSSPETYTRLLREVENCKLHIQDILEDEYDLEYFEPTIGSAYSPKEQTAIRTVITDTPEQAGTIKEFHYGGFRNTTTNKIFQPSTVTVYKKSE